MAKAVAKGLLYPLIGILHLSYWAYSIFGFEPELAVVTAGLVASSLIGIVYLTPLMVLARLGVARRIKLGLKLALSFTSVWSLSLILLVFSEFAKISTMMMFSSALLVILTMLLSSTSMMILILKEKLEF